MLSCKDVTRKLTESLDRELTLAERLQLEMHLAMCQGCRNFKKQMSFLRTACRRYMSRARSSDNDS